MIRNLPLNCSYVQLKSGRGTCWGLDGAREDGEQNKRSFPCEIGLLALPSPELHSCALGKHSRLLWVTYGLGLGFFLEIFLLIITLHASALRNQNSPSCLHISLLQQQRVLQFMPPASLKASETVIPTSMTLTSSFLLGTVLKKHRSEIAETRLSLRHPHSLLNAIPCCV